MSNCCDAADLIGSIEKAMPDDDALISVAENFKVFGDSTRIKIIFALEQAELCVSHLSELMKMNQSAISHQLRILRAAKLVKPRRDGKNIYYSLDDEHISSIIRLGLEHALEAAGSNYNEEAL
ncbi:MAG: metalloregulator ArsR/SmtB family transcription factor [Oscillospiraceae bacterium]|jgi:ArsR family transcriptional regulator|nr:metalloregulator ArsR/SmtB family transcription factor [Oscillospiraceae bacterium]